MSITDQLFLLCYYYSQLLIKCFVSYIYLDRLENDKASHDPLTLAYSMLVFMVKGLFISLHFPYAQFPFTALVKFLIHFGKLLLVWSFAALKFLHSLLMVLEQIAGCFNCITPVIVNPYAPERSIYFFIDPTHLPKTVRNRWANNKRRLLVRMMMYIVYLHSIYS